MMGAGPRRSIGFVLRRKKTWRRHKGTLDPSEPAMPPETETPEVPVDQDP
jgi:hypothetical protein